MTNDASASRKREAYRSLMARGSAGGMGAERALEHIDRLVQISLELGEAEGLERAVRLGEELGSRPLDPLRRATLHCLMATAWEYLRLLGSLGRERVWDWEQRDIESELMHLRRAFDPAALRQMPRQQVSRMLSNMAALMNHVGRFSEALEHWDRSIAWTPGFALARAKRGYALTHYAHALYDREHVQTFLRCAQADLRMVVGGGELGSSREHFQRRLAWVEARVSRGAIEKDVDLFGPAMGSAEEEIYRRWCLENRLFLNPLNDLGPYPIGARDILVPPRAVSVAGGASRLYHGYFNQIKQAYVSARYLYYEGLNASEPHFSDRGVLLFDTRDYPSYSLSVEKIKAAFTMAYSLLDKVAGFLNRYLGLGIPAERVTFRTFWYKGQQRYGGLREEFRRRRNWPLRGLFWLSKDLYENEPGFREAIEPEARELARIRMNLDHHYLKLHDEGPSSDTSIPPDAMALSFERGDFEAKTLRLLKTARAAQMYLCLAIHAEERQRALRGGGEPGLTLNLDILDDAGRL